MAKNWFRACERRAVRLSSRITLGEAEPVSAAVVNLGLGGCCVTLTDPVPVEDTLVLELESANLWDPQRIQCRVVWCESREGSIVAGLEFALDGASMMGLLLDLMGAEAYE